ncbi:MAG: DUF3160 domain-containing protein [Candidatus Falkowbacteria bacterium]
MFDQLPSNQNSSPYSGDDRKQNKLLYILVGLIVVGLVVAAVVVTQKLISSANLKPVPIIVIKPVASSTGILPTNQNATSTFDDSTDFNTLKAEALSFGQFYMAPTSTWKDKGTPITLPLEAKKDIANYYDFTRKIDLPATVLMQINQNGAALIDTPFVANDFTSFVAMARDRNLPQMVSSDYMLWYYQNTMKQIFTDIKANTFYYDLWRINYDYFTPAIARYRSNQQKVGLVNDPAFEAQRRAAAFFAVGLELLKPKKNQLTDQPISPEGKFTPAEQMKLRYDVPEYLATDVEKELKLIYEAKSEVKSPVLLYRRNYKEFVIPAELKNNPKQANFYLAIRWLNSNFPLYNQSDTCENCLLDANDWLINLISNIYITNDFAKDQALKNRWARVYKVYAYFSGLRKDLTFLHYAQVMENLYGKEYNPATVFPLGAKRATAEAEAKIIQTAVADLGKFSALEGAYDRDNTSTIPLIGMRLLQTDYWPDDYIAKQLNYPQVGTYQMETKERATLLNTTRCGKQSGDSTIYIRCLSSGVDIMNILSPNVSSQYFMENSSYEGYSSQIEAMRQELRNFNVSSWHSSDYWNYLNLTAKTILPLKQYQAPINMSNQFWIDNQLRLGLVGWLNLRLPLDDVTLNGAKLSPEMPDESPIFIEPNPELMDELYASTKMVDRMLVTLRLVKELDSTAKKLTDLENDLTLAKELMVKELAGETLNSSDQSALFTMATKFTLIKAGRKSNAKFSGKKAITYSIDKLKSTILVAKNKDKPFLMIMPVINYKETAN